MLRHANLGDNAEAKLSPDPGPDAGVGCPVCGVLKFKIVEQLSGRQLRTLWGALEHEFTEEAWGPIRKETTVALQECESCGFRYFEQSLAGNEAFYRELEGTGYYSPARQEFARTINFAKERHLRNVLDVGCGSGAFLDLASEAGMKTYGLELNTTAGERARAKGHTIYNKLLHELSLDAVADRFDLITLFQVLEHVSDPVAVVTQAIKLLRPQGYLAVAVPSEDGIYRLAPWDPYQWPPHHVSRWRLLDFERLARMTDLTLVQAGGDTLLGSGIESLWRLQNQMASALGKRGHFGGDGVGKILSWAYRKTGMKLFFPKRGNSIYAYLQNS